MTDHGLSPEIDAMGKIDPVLQNLKNDHPDALHMVMIWANRKYGSGSTTVTPSYSNIPIQSMNASIQSETNPHNDLPAIFNAASPQTEPDKALIVSYWFQEILKEDSIDSQAVNKELTHLGHKILNITRAFNKLTDQKPQLMIQTSKDGTSKQARKRLRLTHVGIKKAESMIQGGLPNIAGPANA